MARPQALQFLRHGKALCGSVFRFFVETWNYIVRRCDSISGDMDANPSEGCIYVDNSDPEHPVIRLDRSKLPLGEGETVINPQYPSVYEIRENQNGKYFADRYYMVGGVLKDGPNGTVSGFAGKVVAILIQQNENTVTLQAFNNIAAMQLAMADQTKVVIPLYVLDANCEITLDLRHIPTGDLWNIGGVS